MSTRYSIDDHLLDTYLREIRDTPLLTQDDEARLARLIKGNGSRGEKALQKLTSANLRFVVLVAKLFQNQGLPLADLINEGNIGLIKAAKRFDETRGFKFISYAVWWIRQAIFSALAEQSRIMRLPVNQAMMANRISKVSAKLEQKIEYRPSLDEIAQELGISEIEVAHMINISGLHLSLDQSFSASEDNCLYDVLENKHQPSPDESLLSHSLTLEIEKALNTLTAREAEVITLYFGLNHEKAITFEEIGARFSLTRERMRQIKEKAINKLKHVTRSRALREYLT